MINRIKKILNLGNGQDGAKPVAETKQFTFMITKDDVGKSVTISAPDHIEAEKELKKEYPDHKIQFLWEWK